jgi:hypothetical protein
LFGSGVGGCEGKRRSEEADEIFESDSPRCETGRLVAGLGEVWGGLPHEEGAGERSCAGRGEIGTFQMTASSGRSSSPSSMSHSASRSLAVLRAACCHDCRLAAIEGDTSRFRELLRDRERWEEEEGSGLFGEGERERRTGACRLVMLASEGADGDEKPLRRCFPGAWSCDPARKLWLVWIFIAAGRGFDPFVRSRNEWGAPCGMPRDGEASKSIRFGECGTGKDAGPASSARLMSSK